MAGPIGLHPEDGFLKMAKSDGTGGDEDTPSITNISSETLLGICTGGELSGADLR